MLNIPEFEKCRFHHIRFSTTVYLIVLMFSALTPSTQGLHAQGFAEDFSNANLLRYSLTTSSTQSTPDLTENSQAPILSGAFIRPSGGAATIRQFQRLNVHSESNLLEARVILSPQIRDGLGTAGARIQLRLYNDTAEGSPGYSESGRGSSEGDIRVLLEYRTSGERTPTVRLRGQRFNNGSFSDIPGFFNLAGGNSSGNIALNNIDTRVNREHTLLVDVDLQNRQITYGFDSVRDTVTFNAPQIFTPNRLIKGIETQAFENNRDGAQKEIRASVTVNGIRTQNFNDDFTRQAPSLRYSFPDTELPAAAVQIAGGSLRISTQRSRAASRTLSTEFAIQNDVVAHTDYHEVTMVLSSSSLPSAGREVQIRLGGTFYNDLPNGPNDSFRGNQLAFIALALASDGSTNAMFCTVRFNNTNGSNLTVSCEDFDNNFAPNLDTRYQASIELDRNARVLRFVLLALDNADVSFERTVAIDTTINAPLETTRFISSYLQGGQAGQAVGFFDNLRTRPDAVSIPITQSLPNTPSAPITQPIVVTTPSPSVNNQIDSTSENLSVDPASNQTTDTVNNSPVAISSSTGDGNSIRVGSGGAADPLLLLMMIASLANFYFRFKLRICTDKAGFLAK